MRTGQGGSGPSRGTRRWASRAPRPIETASWNTFLAGKSAKLSTDFGLVGGALPPPQATPAPSLRYHRVEWVCEAARDAVWYFLRRFCGPQGPRSRRRRGKIRPFLRAPKTLQLVCVLSAHVPGTRPCLVAKFLHRSDGGRFRRRALRSANPAKSPKYSHNLCAFPRRASRGHVPAL